MPKLKRKFHEKINDLLIDTFKMAELSGNMINRSIDSFLTRDEKLAEETIRVDDEVDQLNLEIEASGIGLLAMQQPMAKDLRLIAGLLKIVIDIERLGDYSVDIAKAVKNLSNPPSPEVSNIIINMRKTIFEMLDSCLLPLKKGGPETLQDIVDKDELIDDWYDEICEHVVNRLLERQSESHGRHEMAVQLTARHLERIADHITNICERVHYIITGEFVELHKD